MIKLTILKVKKSRFVFMNDFDRVDIDIFALLPFTDNNFAIFKS